MQMETVGKLLARYREKANELRTQLGEKPLTQLVLAGMVGVSPVSVRNWESSINMPGARHLRNLIKIYLSEGAFPKGREEEAAKALWNMVGRKENFEEEWFRALPKSRYRPFSGDERLTLQRALAMNPRGVSLLDAIREVGLIDIESREDRQHALPPWEYYELAEREIVITGVTLLRTFNQHIRLLQQLLDKGRKVFALILHPNSSDVTHISGLEKLDIPSQIEQVISVIRDNELDEKGSGFHVRFMEKMPPFTAVMLDGDLSPNGISLVQGAQIRVQPRTAYGIQRNGIILQFKKLHDNQLEAFNYFAEDLRQQWFHAKELNDVLGS